MLNTNEWMTSREEIRLTVQHLQYPPETVEDVDDLIEDVFKPGCDEEEAYIREVIAEIHGIES